MSKIPSRPVSWTQPYIDDARADIDPGAKTWITRGANFVIVISEAEAGAVLSRSQEEDEYVVLTSGPSVTVKSGGETLHAASQSVTIVPPGDSSVTMDAAGQVVRVFTRSAVDLAERAGNAGAYAGGVEDVAPLNLWPEPEGGYRLRNYLLEEHTRDDINMRIFDTRGLMVNVTKVRNEARDPATLTPHSHADFEQGSLCLTGTYVHHLRYPWTPDLEDWRADEHIELNSPSVLVITPKVIHTSRNLAGEPGWLIDVFSPPREDFFKRGVVANAKEYPMPKTTKLHTD